MLPTRLTLPTPRTIPATNAQFHGTAGGKPASPGTTGIDIRAVATPASKTLLRFIDAIAECRPSRVLDAAGGYGRNAAALASSGCHVVCVDRDLNRLRQLKKTISPSILPQPQTSGCIQPICADLAGSLWLFRDECFDAIVCVHFVRLDLFDFFRRSLRPGGYLYFETFDGHGENYLALPDAGHARARLDKDFDLRFYREKRVGPASSGAVSVRLFARKRC